MTQQEEQELIQRARELSPSAKLQLLDELASGRVQDETEPLSPEWREELQRRDAVDHDAWIPWEQAREQLRAGLRSARP